MSTYERKDFDESIKERLQDSTRVELVCTEHNYKYGSKKPWNYKCKQCNYVNYLGLYMSVPPSRREEMLEALEEGIHHMVESAERGELQLQSFLQHPEVNITKN